MNPITWATAANMVVDNYMYWQLINNTLALALVFGVVGAVMYAIWRFLDRP